METVANEYRVTLKGAEKRADTRRSVLLPIELLKIREQRLTSQARVVHACLGRMARWDGKVTIRYGRLCRLAGIGLNATQNAVQILDRCGWIFIRKKREKRRLVCDLNNPIGRALDLQVWEIDQRIQLATGLAH